MGVARLQLPEKVARSLTEGEVPALDPKTWLTMDDMGLAPAQVTSALFPLSSMPGPAHIASALPSQPDAPMS